MLITVIKSDPRAREKPCLRCGLPLRKHLDATHCPQCGLSVWLSLNDNRSLDWSNPPWLARLSTACWIMGPAQLIAAVAYALLVIPLAPPPKRYAIAAIAAGLYLILYHLGLLLASMHENRYPDYLKVYRNANRIITTLAILFGLTVLAQGLAHLPTGWPTPQSTTAKTHARNSRTNLHQPEFGSPSFLWQSRWFLGSALLPIASAVGTFAFLRRLAHRIPNSTVARICGYVLLLPLISFLMLFPILGVCLLMSLLSLARYAPAIYFPLTAALLLWFAVAFRRASRDAAQNWANETSAPHTPSRTCQTTP